MRTIEDQLQEVLHRLENVQRAGKNYTARCPAHDDLTNSLSVRLGKNKDRIVLKCHAVKGCSFHHILGALKMKEEDLFAQKTNVVQNNPNDMEPVPLPDPESAEPFPIGIYPQFVQDFVGSLAESIPCRVDLPACFALGTAAGAIGASRVIEIKPGYRECALLHLIVTAGSGDGKSPAMAKTIEPLETISKQVREQYVKERKKWENLDPTDRGSAPIERLVTVGSFTFEKLTTLLSQNPHGLVYAEDELAALMKSMNEYKGGQGSDRQTFLKLWGRNKIQVHRVKQGEQERAWCEKPTITILGCLTENNLQLFFGNEKDATDGLAERFLFSYPLPMEGEGLIENWQTVQGVAEQQWHDCIVSLWNLGSSAKKRKDPISYPVCFSEDAKAVWKLGSEKFAQMKKDDEFPDILKPGLSKLKAYFARLVLILHCLNRVTREGSDKECKGPIEAKTMEQAWTLMEYFISHLFRARGYLTGHGSIAITRKVLDAICSMVRSGEMSFTRSRLHQRSLKRVLLKPANLDEHLKLLMQHRYIFRTDNRTDFRDLGNCLFSANPVLAKDE